MKHILRKIFDLPRNADEAILKKRVNSDINSLGFNNVLVSECTLYEDDVEIVVIINHSQDIVKSGLPKQTLLYTDFNEIVVSYLASTYDETDIKSELDIQDIETLPFTWQLYKDLIVKYQPQTY